MNGNAPIPDGSLETEIEISAREVFIRLSTNLTIKGCHLSIKEDMDAVKESVARHFEYLGKHGISQEHIDPFKLVCWQGDSILDKFEKDRAEFFPKIFDALISTLEELLHIETNGQLILPRHTKDLLCLLLMAERTGCPRHGIGMNGLYASFHVAVECYHHSHANGQNGVPHSLNTPESSTPAHVAVGRPIPFKK